jgi:hypothetical protein
MLLAVAARPFISLEKAGQIKALPCRWRGTSRHPASSSGARKSGNASRRFITG